MKKLYYPFRNLIILFCGLFLCMQTFAQSTNPAPYCYPTASNMTDGTCTGTGGPSGFGYTLSEVKLNSLLQTGSCYGGSNTDVYRYWNATTSLNAGSSYNISMSVPYSTTSASVMSLGFWIDYDQDSTFDSVELVRSVMGKGSSFTFSVPCSAKAGVTRMRVRVQSTLVNGNDACGSPSGYGETWDFDVTIVQPSSVTADFTYPSGTHYVKNPVNFSNVNGPASGYQFHQWDINNDGTIDKIGNSFAPDMVYTWTSAGSKCVKLRSTNCFGKDSVVKWLTITAPSAKPVTDFNSCGGVLEQYESIQLFDNSSNGPWQWEWDVYDSVTYASSKFYPSLQNGEVQGDPWGNGNDEYSKNPEFSFDVPGNYTVTLRTKNDVGVSNLMKKVNFVRINIPVQYNLGYGTYGLNNDNIVDGNYGYIYDDGGPNYNYRNTQGVKTRSYLVIDPSSKRPVFLEFKQIRLKDTKDSIVVYGDNKRNPSKILGVYTSANNGTNPVLVSPSGKMYFYFRSDSTGVDSGFQAIYYADGYDQEIKGFELLHNVLKTGRPSLFYNRFNNNLVNYYAKTWKVDGVVQNAFANRDTLKYTFTDTAAHSVCLEFSSCDTTFSRCEYLHFDQGIMGRLYKDDNANCGYNAGENAVKGIKVSLYDGSNNLLESIYTGNDGTFDFPKGAGAYKVVIDTSAVPFVVNCPYPGTDTAFTLSSGNLLADGLDFALNCKSGYDLGATAVSTNGIVFPGRTHELRIIAGDLSKWYGLNCSSGISGQVQVTVTGKVSYVNKLTGTLTPSVSGNVFTYSISDFANVDMYKDFGLLMRVDTTARGNDSIMVHVRITPTGSDSDTSNNDLDFTYRVLNSYDPNMKEVFPENVHPGFKDWLTYTIHFQNTGNAPAFDVRLADTLDEDLNLETFQVLSYSHPVRTSLKGRVLSFMYKDIMLADSFSDEKASHGFVQYRIKPKAGLPLGAKIENTAYIYFDFNEPVVTNTTKNEYVKEPEIKNPYVIIPDPGFVTWLNANLSICMKGNKLDTSCPFVKSTQALNLGSSNIADLDGIQYFPRLALLDCHDNKLIALPPLSSKISNLNCSGNQLTQLPTLPSDLATLDCSGNQLQQLPSLPASLGSLICSNNALGALPALPSGLTFLNCSGNQLQQLPALPSGMSSLYCNDNVLTALPTLPASLSSLDFSGNQVSKLPALPGALTVLILKDNQVDEISMLPSSLLQFDCSNNLIKCLSEIPAGIQQIHISGNAFKCLPNYISVMSSADKKMPLCRNNDSVNNPYKCVSLLTSVDNQSVLKASVYPNPGSGIFHLELSRHADADIRIYNILGELVYNGIMNGSSLNIDLAAQPSGIYRVMVKGENLEINTSLIKQ